MTKDSTEETHNSLASSYIGQFVKVQRCGFSLYTVQLFDDKKCCLTEKYWNYDTVLDLLAFLRMSHFLRLGRRQRSSMLGTHS